MVWLHRSPVVVGRERACANSNCFYLPSRWLQEGEGETAPCGKTPDCLLMEAGRRVHDAWYERLTVLEVSSDYT